MKKFTNNKFVIPAESVLTKLVPTKLVPAKAGNRELGAGIHLTK